MPVQQCAGLTVKNTRCGLYVSDVIACKRHISQFQSPPLPPEQAAAKPAPKKLPKPAPKPVKPVKPPSIELPAVDPVQDVPRVLDVPKKLKLPRPSSPEQLRIKQLEAQLTQEKKRAEDEKKRAENEKKRAENEKKRAENEKKRAEDEKKRAEDEKKRADEIERNAIIRVAEEKKQAAAVIDRMRTTYQEVPDLDRVGDDGVIYAMTHPELECKNYYKIGCSKDISTRFGTYKTSGAAPKCVAMIILDNGTYDLKAIEGYIHERLTTLRVAPSLGLGNEVFMIKPEKLKEFFSTIKQDILAHGKLVTDIKIDLVEDVKNDAPPSKPLPGIELRQKSLTDMTTGELLDYVCNSMAKLYNERFFHLLKDTDHTETIGEIIKVTWQRLRKRFEKQMLHEINGARESRDESDHYYTSISYGGKKSTQTVVSVIVNKLNAIGLMIDGKKLHIEYSRNNGLTYYPPKSKIEVGPFTKKAIITS
jgi:hypothetical protein